MQNAETVRAVMSELAAKRWRGQVAIRCARELLPRVDELPPAARSELLAALTEQTRRETAS